jgi:hypothetical protein
LAFPIEKRRMCLHIASKDRMDGHSSFADSRFEFIELLYS